MMDEETFSLVQECTNKYYVENRNKDEVEIHIRIPKKFRSLWLSKLSDLRSTQKEIEEYKDNEIEEDGKSNNHNLFVGPIGS